MFKKIGNNYDAYIEGLKKEDPEAVTNILKGDYLGKISNIPIYKNASFMINNGLYGACCVKDYLGNYYIVIDNLFSLLNKNTQEFLLCHELGHYRRGHLEGVFGTIVDINNEFEADEYAAGLIGYQEAIDALKEFYSKILSIQNKSNKIDTLLNISVNKAIFKARIKNLKKKK